MAAVFGGAGPAWVGGASQGNKRADKHRDARRAADPTEAREVGATVSATPLRAGSRKAAYTEPPLAGMRN